MNSLSATDILRVWELGQDKPAWYRALLLLAPALPNLTQDQLAALSIGQRNTYLFALRERVLGSTMEAFVQCPQCSEPLEFPLNVSDICQADPTQPLEQEHTLIMQAFELRFRLLNSQDLATIANYDDVIAARWRLINHCILQVQQDGKEIEIKDLPESIITTLAEQMNDYDPQAEIYLDLDCPTCKLNWSSAFDIASFLWTEVSVQAKHLLNHVYILANAYGWREADILSMSAVRRQSYIDMVS